VKKKKIGLKDYFVTGMFSILPLLFTVWVAQYLLKLAWNSFFSLFVPLVDQGMHQIADQATVQGWEAAHLHEVIGLVLILAFVIFVGLVARQFVGSGLIRLVDKIMNAIPGVNWIYSTIHQLTDTMDPASPQHDAFRKPVLVKLEHGYLLGFMTSRSVLRGAKGARLATVFFPCNQLIQGYNLLVEEKRCTPVNMNVDEAIKYVVSFGMMAPPIFQPSVKKKLH
jgi:uncharacterized membrane protein